MICPTCQTELPPLALACEACMRSKYRAGLEQSEIKLMPHILGSELDLKILLSGQTHHLGFHDGFTTTAYCQAKPRSPFISYVKFKDRPDKLCPKCASALKEFLKRAGIPVTR